MATKRQLIARCKELGVALTDEGDKLEMFAPPGKVMRATALHFVTYWDDGGMRGNHIPRADTYLMMLEDLSMGLDDCDLPPGECDACDEAREQGGVIPDDVPPSAILTK